MLALLQNIRLLEWRILATVALVIAAMAHPESLDGQRSRELTESIVEDHTFALDHLLERDGFIDAQAQASGKPTPGGDRAYYNGHYYAGVAPGLSMLMLPLVAVIEPLAARAAPGAWHDRNIRIVVFNFASVLLIMIPFALATTLLVHRTHVELFGRPRLATALTFLYSFGTLAFYYAVCLNAWMIINFASWCFMYVAFVRRAPLSTPIAVALGLVVGLGVCMNYFGIVLFPLFAAVLVLRRQFQASVFMTVGVAAMLLPLGWYHLHLFGSPWATPYSHRVDASIDQIMSSGVQGFHLPSPAAALQLLFLSLIHI